MTVSSQINSDILTNLGESSSDETLQSMAYRWMQKTYDKIVTAIPEAEYLQKSEMTITMIEDQATYALPDNFFSFVILRDDDNSTILTQITRQEFDRLHPDPSDEDSGLPTDYTLEYDRTSKRHIIRIAPVPDDGYTFYASMRCWPTDLGAAVDPTYPKLRTAIEEGGIYEGSKVLFADPEYMNYRLQLKGDRDEAILGISRIFAIQKPNPPQVPVVMKRSNYAGSR